MDTLKASTRALASNSPGDRVRLTPVRTVTTAGEVDAAFDAATGRS